ncbi:phage tail family protein [Enterococcus hirae]|nr:phage tail family protein [Enterococcus hirae]
MYDFKNTKKGYWSDDRLLPASAMRYDGIYLENIIDGYRTLVVTGREMISLEMETENVHRGTKISTQKLNAREITVQFQLIEQDSEEFQRKFRQLMGLLYRKEDVEIIFNDEPSIIYYGRYQSAETVPGDANSITSSFTIYCQDPQKYSREKKSGSQITVNSPIETTPSKIIVKLSRGSSIQIKNRTTGALIKITSAAIYAGNTVTFDFARGKVMVNGVNRTAILDLDSDFENFYIHRGDMIECNNGTMDIYCREVYI